jgi:hypothetical protein
MLGTLTFDAPVTELSLAIYPLRPFHLGAAQLTLFGSRPLSSSSSQVTFGQALRETLRRLWNRFGDLSVLVASLVVAPAPRPIQVTTDRETLPQAVVWHERIWEVESIYEHWRDRRRWWSRPVERDYFRLELEGGRIKVVFRDVETDRWYVERRHI